MKGNNTTPNAGLILTNHVKQRKTEREISQSAINLARRYGTEGHDRGARKVVIDFDACVRAADFTDGGPQL